MKKISVLIVDDHQLFREGLKLLLGVSSIVGEVYQASDGNEFLDFIENMSPDIVLMDINMPIMDGIEATTKALKEHPEMKIIALSMFGDDEYYIKMIEAGAKGFIVKNSDIEVVETAIQQVMEGKTYFASDVMATLVMHLNQRKNEETKNELSERESEILYMICKGLSNQEIADALFLSKRTVDKHRENILAKTQAKNTAGLVLYAIKHNIIQV
ncbi:MAG TPA: response regulator transcription factor [Prolixibacteraceae bacterium]|nr:response regulator transcription factor [Prolixibacteraceae bacterium]